MLVLLVEDDLDLSALVAEFLEDESIECDLAYNGVMGLELIKTNQYDVIIMDVMMPRMDGLTLCSKIRELGVSTPCLMLTARDTLEDKLMGFDKGADDYMVKPFDLPELVARLKVLARRSSNSSGLLQIARPICWRSTSCRALLNICLGVFARSEKVKYCLRKR